MSMISESGAVADITELAATLELSPEQVQEINALSLEQICNEFETLLENPELSDTDVTVFEPALESLRHVYHSVKDSGTISRHDASLMMKMSASLENFNDPFTHMPLVSFTEMPSKVNYQPSMEGMLSSIVRRIWEAIKALIAKIKSFYSGSAVAETRSAVMEKKVEDELVKRVIKVDFKKVDKLATQSADSAGTHWRDVNAFFDAAIRDNRLVEVVYVYEPFLNSALQNVEGALDALFDANRKVAAMYSIEWLPVDPELDRWAVATRQMGQVIRHFTAMVNQPVKYSVQDMSQVAQHINTATQQMRKQGVVRIFTLWKKVWATFNTDQLESNKKWREAQDAGDEETANKLLLYISDRYSIAHCLSHFNTIRTMMAAIKLDMAKVLDEVNSRTQTVQAA